MTATRSTKEEHTYKQYRRKNTATDCPFCAVTIGHPQYVEETDNFMVIRNQLPYSIWDGQGVVEHFMLIPKRHTDSLSDIETAMLAEYFELLSKYESNGYNIYARTPKSKVKSVHHQHTHLIQLDNRERRFLFMLRKPFYIRASYK